MKCYAMLCAFSLIEPNLFLESGKRLLHGGNLAQSVGLLLALGGYHCLGCVGHEALVAELLLNAG